jgi:predicted Zn-dependent protease
LGSKVEWRRALKAASLDLDQHLQLVRLTGTWQWEPEAEEVLWQVVNTWSSEKWAFLSRAKILASRGNTAGLQSLYARVSASDPGNLAVVNNWIMVTLLLSPSDKSAHQKARDLYKTHNANPVLASTYAFSLLLQNQKDEALEVIKKLPPRALNDPMVAVYYGLILNACGRTEDARPLLEAGSKTLLLPEEKQLVARALGRS